MSCQPQEATLGNITSKLGEYKIGLFAIAAFAVVAFAHHGWFAA
jgi:hypothetical protein